MSNVPGYRFHPSAQNGVSCVHYFPDRSTETRTSVDAGNVEILFLERTHYAISMGVDATLVFHFTKGSFIDKKRAIYFQQLMDAHPQVESFHVRSEARELVIWTTAKTKINVVLPKGAGKFKSTGAVPVLPKELASRVLMTHCHGLNFPPEFFADSSVNRRESFAPFDERRCDASSTKQMVTTTRKISFPSATSPFLEVYRIHEKARCRALPDVDVHDVLMAQIKVAIQDTSSTLCLRFKSFACMDVGAAELLHKLLGEDPGVAQFFVRGVDGKELVVKAANGRVVNVIIPVGCGKFYQPAEGNLAATDTIPAAILPGSANTHKRVFANVNVNGSANETSNETTKVSAAPKRKSHRPRGSLPSNVMVELKAKQDNVHPESTRSNDSSYTFTTVADDLEKKNG